MKRSGTNRPSRSWRSVLIKTLSRFVLIALVAPSLASCSSASESADQKSPSCKAGQSVLRRLNQLSTDDTKVLDQSSRKQAALAEQALRGLANSMPNTSTAEHALAVSSDLEGLVKIASADPTGAQVTTHEQLRQQLESYASSTRQFIADVSHTCGDAE